MLRQDEQGGANNGQSSTEIMMKLLSVGFSPYLNEIIQQQQETLAPLAEAVAPVVEQVQLTAEQLAAQLAEEKRRLEEEKNEWIKRQADALRQEEQNEKFRVKNFDDHAFLVTQGAGQSYEMLRNRIDALSPLLDPIPRFCNSPKQGLPRSSRQCGSLSMFDTVLQNSNLTVQNKYELLVRLFDLGYHLYYKMLLIEPLIQVLLQDDGFNVMLWHLYRWSLRDGGTETDLSTEMQIWRKVIADGNGCELFDALCASSSLNPRRFFEYVELWMNMMKSPVEIINRCRYIEHAISNSRMAHHVSDVYKLGKLRLFDIVIEIIKENRDAYSDYLRAPDPNAGLAQALEFLKTHRNSVLKGGFGATKSSCIYEMIPSDIDLARQMHEKEKVRFREELYQKIHNEMDARPLLSFIKI